MPTWQDLVALIAAYLLGCIATAYYLVRLRIGQDIRQLGSGSVGGRNAGRVLGRAGFVVVVIGDGLKGLLAVLLARLLGVGAWGMGLVVLAVVAGHIWPVQLGFKGGKGIATLIGALLGYNSMIVVLLAGLFLALFGLAGSATIAFLLALVLAPLLLLLMAQPASTLVAIIAAAALVVFAHRGRIREKLQGRVGLAQPQRPLTRRGE